MPSLHILKGANQGATVPLAKDRFVIGRNPECDVVIPITSVSREHAQILRVQGRFHIEDMQSRNGTFVNNIQIGSRTQLKNNDRVRICDFLAVFLDADPREFRVGPSSRELIEALSPGAGEADQAALQIFSSQGHWTAD